MFNDNCELVIGESRISLTVLTANALANECAPLSLMQFMARFNSMSVCVEK